MSIRFPDNSHRTVIIGPTGCGKTVFGVWLLSTCCTLDFQRYPVFIFDFKGDELIAKIEDVGGAKEIDIRKSPPKKPGLYILRPHPHEGELVEQFLWKVWANGKSGLYFDEGYMVAKSNALNAILTQGRSKKIPVVILAQRPVWLSRFTFSEAQFFAIFSLIDKRDRDTVQSFISTDLQQHRLPYHSLWYDVGGNAGRGSASILSPVPPVPEIVASFAKSKEAPRKKVV